MLQTGWIPVCLVLRYRWTKILSMLLVGLVLNYHVRKWVKLDTDWGVQISGVPLVGLFEQNPCGVSRPVRFFMQVRTWQSHNRTASVWGPVDTSSATTFVRRISYAVPAGGRLSHVLLCQSTAVFIFRPKCSMDPVSYLCRDCFPGFSHVES